jgi:hypothetical protein
LAAKVRASAAFCLAGVVAGTGLYFGNLAYVREQTHRTLHVASVSVAVANPPVKCNGTADVIGTIITNGSGGQVSYEWVSDGVTSPATTITVASGQSSATVQLRWVFHGRGTPRATAELIVLAPDSARASVQVAYSCP